MIHPAFQSWLQLSHLCKLSFGDQEQQEWIVAVTTSLAQPDSFPSFSLLQFINWCISRLSVPKKESRNLCCFCVILVVACSRRNNCSYFWKYVLNQDLIWIIYGQIYHCWLEKEHVVIYLWLDLPWHLLTRFSSENGHSIINNMSIWPYYRF